MVVLAGLQYPLVQLAVEDLREGPLCLGLELFQAVQLRYRLDAQLAQRRDGRADGQWRRGEQQRELRHATMSPSRARAQAPEAAQQRAARAEKERRRMSREEGERAYEKKEAASKERERERDAPSENARARVRVRLLFRNTRRRET